MVFLCGISKNLGGDVQQHKDVQYGFRPDDEAHLPASERRWILTGLGDLFPAAAAGRHSREALLLHLLRTGEVALVQASPCGVRAADDAPVHELLCKFLHSKLIHGAWGRHKADIEAGRKPADAPFQPECRVPGRELVDKGKSCMRRLLVCGQLPVATCTAARLDCGHAPRLQHARRLPVCLPAALEAAVAGGRYPLFVAIGCVRHWRMLRWYDLALGQGRVLGDDLTGHKKRSSTFRFKKALLWPAWRAAGAGSACRRRGCRRQGAVREEQQEGGSHQPPAKRLRRQQQQEAAVPPPIAAVAAPAATRSSPAEASAAGQQRQHALQPRVPQPPAQQQPQEQQLVDLLLGVEQPAAAAAGLSEELAASFIALLPVQADQARAQVEGTGRSHARLTIMSPLTALHQSHSSCVPLRLAACHAGARPVPLSAQLAVQRGGCPHAYRPRPQGRAAAGRRLKAVARRRPPSLLPAYCRASYLHVV